MVRALEKLEELFLADLSIAIGIEAEEKKIRHPLQALSGYIRRYIILEGLAVALLYLAICFWVWLLLDFGTFALFGVDAVKWLDRTYPAETAFFIRAFVLGMIAVGLVALLITWVQIKDVQNIAAQIPYVASGGLLGREHRCRGRLSLSDCRQQGDGGEERPSREESCACHRRNHPHRFAPSGARPLSPLT